MEKIIELNKQEVSIISGGIGSWAYELAGKAAFAFGTTYLFEKQFVEGVIWKVKKPNYCENINLLGPSILPLSVVFAGIYLLAEDITLNIKGLLADKNKT